jgi:hypothetical protein
MKRKSIFLTIVAVLFASVAWGQIAIPLPAPDSKVVDADTIYFCADGDSVYPIEFGYDVSGRQLHPSYGDWHLLGKTNSSVKVDDYDFNKSVKNGGAGNAYKGSGTGIGGILFEYTAKDKQCGLEVGQKFWVYVFVLPKETSPVTKSDTFICYATSGTVTINFATVFKEYVDLYKTAGLSTTTAPLTPRWVDGSFDPIRKDSIATYTLRDTLVITPKSGYTCGDSIPFLLTVKVDSIVRDTIAQGLTICAADTVGDLGTRGPNVFFKRNLPSGKYYTDDTYATESTKISPWGALGTPTSKGYYLKKFYYKYTDCKAKTRYIIDTLYLIPSDKYLADDSIGLSTVYPCRKPGTVPILSDELFKATSYSPKPVFSLDNTDSYWTDMGTKNKEITTSPNDDYGTKSSTTSLLNGHDLNFDDMRSNVGYYYMWNVDNSVHTCFVDEDGNPGWGTMRVIIQDPVVSQDYTAQLCKSSYTSGSQFDLNVYTGLDVKWHLNTKGGTEIPAGQIQPDTMKRSTYKYVYEVPGGCGSGGTGVFYVKVSNGVKAPVNKKVLYCLEKLPASINLNDVLGVAIKGLKWNSLNSLDGDDGFDDTLGTLDVTKYIEEHKAIPAVLSFDLTGNTGDLCGVSTSTKLVIEFVGSGSFF